jgi:putative transposase
MDRVFMPSRLKRFDVPGHAHFWTISCFHRLSFFWEDSVKQVAVDGLDKMRVKHGICLLGYVVMPEHVHVLLYPQIRGSQIPISISDLLRDFKQFVGFHGKVRLRDYWREHKRLWSEPLNAWAQGRLGSQDFWNTRCHDFNIDQHATLLEKLEYCHNNPVKRGLVLKADEWKWSSCRFFSSEDRSVLPMDWRGEYPIEW